MLFIVLALFELAQSFIFTFELDTDQNVGPNVARLYRFYCCEALAKQQHYSWMTAWGPGRFIICDLSWSEFFGWRWFWVAAVRWISGSSFRIVRAQPTMVAHLSISFPEPPLPLSVPLDKGNGGSGNEIAHWFKFIIVFLTVLSC